MGFSRSLVYQLIMSAVVLLVFVVWVEVAPDNLRGWTEEDGVIENLTSLFFGLSAVGFVLVARRSQFLKNKKSGLRYTMVVAWIVLMFVFCGEEISWGQRIFGIETPESIGAVNKQDELNIHNIEFVDTFMGGKYRYLSLMMLAIGLAFPLFAAFPIGRRTIQWWAFPVTPAGFSIVFVGAYWFGKYYVNESFNDADASEVREFLLSAGMLLFAWYGAFRPDELFRAHELPDADQGTRTR